MFLALFVIFSDVVTKYMADAYLPLMSGEFLDFPYGGVPVFSDFFGIEFSLVHAVNYGAAWSLFSGHQLFVLWVRLFLIASVFIYAYYLNKNRSYDLPLTLIISGALANVLDYFIYGHVIDMFYFVFWGYDYPVFNIADSAICVGVTLFFLTSIFSPQSSET